MHKRCHKKEDSRIFDKTLFCEVKYIKIFGKFSPDLNLKCDRYKNVESQRSLKDTEKSNNNLKDFFILF